MARGKLTRGFLIALGCWAVAFFIALKLGASPGADLDLVTGFRLPRALLASAVGMGLAVAGAALQSIFANPLAEPYTLGISSGSAFGAVVGAALGFEWLVAGVAGSAFLGALLFASVLYLISLRPGTGNLTLLLAGVMLGFLGSSLVALWMALADPNGIQGAIVWLIGDLSRARLRGAVFTMTAVVTLVFMIWGRWRDLDALLMGEEEALALGIPVTSARRRLIILTALLIGLCVSASGMIGFVGLVIPHVARRFSGSLHRALLPMAAVWGAASLTLADAIARYATRPFELPVGIVTALVGAPVFLWVILQRRTRA